jgi:NTP pyrophosphatase (non-canonical NTP hydrolase)
MRIQEAQHQVDIWIKKYGVRYFNELTNMSVLTEEVGELARLISRVYGEQSFKRQEDAELAPENIKSELADILFVLICLANQMGIDLEEAFVQTLNKKTLRDSSRHEQNAKLKAE